MTIRRGIVSDPTIEGHVRPGGEVFPSGELTPGGRESQAQRLWPPVGEASSRPVVLTVVNEGDGPLELLETLRQWLGEGLPVAAHTARVLRLAAGDELWAGAVAGECEVVVAASD